VDGCTNYTVFRQASHAHGDVAHSNPTCESKDLVTGWYRLQGAVEDWVTDKCVSKEHFGVWLIVSQPTVTEGAVTREVCFSGNKPCCL